MDDATRTLPVAAGVPARGETARGGDRAAGHVGRRRSASRRPAASAATESVARRLVPRRSAPQQRTRSNVRLLFGSLIAMAVAACVGLGSTWLTLTRGTAFGAVAIGAWTAWPKTGTTDIDPYARATIARSGELPVGLGDGVAFFAWTESRAAARRPLRRGPERHHAAGPVLDPHAL